MAAAAASSQRPLRVVEAPPHLSALSGGAAGVREAFRAVGAVSQSAEGSGGLDWRAVADVGLFAGLVGLGLWMVRMSTEELTALGFIGPLLFGAGLTPFVLSLWALMTGAQLFRRQQLIKTLFSGAVVSLGFGLWQVAEATRDGDGETVSLLDAVLGFDRMTVLAVFGPALLELGALFFVEKLLCLEEDDGVRIERLEAELAAARASPAFGLALSYFYNFLLPTAANFGPPSGGDTAASKGTTDLEIEVARGQFRPGTLASEELVVVLPRTLDADTDIKGLLRDMQQKQGVLAGRPVAREPTHRPLFVFLVPESAAAAEAAGAGAEEGRVTRSKTEAAAAAAGDSSQMRCAFDIPTVVSSIWHRAADAKAQREAAAGDGGSDTDAAVVPEVDVEEELLLVLNALTELVQGHPGTRGRVAIVSVDDLHDFTATDVLTIASTQQ